MGRVGFDTAERYLGHDGDPTTVYERSMDVPIAGLYLAMRAGRLVPWPPSHPRDPPVAVRCLGAVLGVEDVVAGACLATACATPAR
ncbi:hypothetical protein [Nonomuraea sediminis]|uniref:hypothetical protein n=1 Tax=Nonomuraea sediminis TaxID=2835864 RepID=UPI001BDBD0CF|nr:hypothetical protein [Nonomuraea sediminis]